MFVKTIGSRINPYYQAADGTGEGRRIFFRLTDYRNNLIGEEMELLHQSLGLFVEQVGSEIRFPKGHDFVFGKFFPRLADGVNADNSISGGIDGYKLIDPPLGVLTGKISQRNFGQGEPSVIGVIGSEIFFDIFLTDAQLNRPANLGMADKIELVFCGADGSQVVVPVQPTSSSSVGYLPVEIPAAQSALLDSSRGRFDLKLYSGDKLLSVTPFINALTLVKEICN